VAESEEQYVQIATGLAGDIGQLERWRSELRGMMQASPLMDAPRFARNMEAAYRTAWRQWCEAHESNLR
jgi:protein O-GlcNAc transferase